MDTWGKLKEASSVCVSGSFPFVKWKDKTANANTFSCVISVNPHFEILIFMFIVFFECFHGVMGSKNYIHNLYNLTEKIFHLFCYIFYLLSHEW